MECKFCGSEIEDTEIQCPVCKQSLVEVKPKIKVRCLISNYETEIDENDNEFYCEKCFSNHIIDGEDFIKVSKTQENENLNKTPLEKEIKEEAIYLILKNNENEIIKIPKIGGNVGRQGDYGARIFEKYYMNKVSRLHFRIEYNSLNEWVIWHLSTTNDTEVNK